jgi:hypothetical protein
METTKIIALVVAGILIGALIVRSDDWQDVVGGIMEMAFFGVLGYYLLK